MVGQNSLEQNSPGQALPGALQEAARAGSPFFISIVIVNYNGARWLERCLSSLVAQTFEAYRIFLVDNASTDDSRALVEKKFPDVQIVQSETNVGFASGNNLGIHAARANFAAGQGAREHLIATLNTDTYVEEDYMERLSAPMRDKTVGACAPLMLELERPDIVDAAGIRVDVFGFAWNIGAGERADRFAEAGEVYGACAGAALYRDAMLKDIGTFDDAYFGFYEDADLAWRARAAGWKTAFAPNARVYHQHGASFGRIAQQKTYLLTRNRWWTTFKNYPMPQFLLALPVICALDAGALVRAALRGHGRTAWRGRVDAWRTRAQMRAKHQMLKP